MDSLGTPSFERNTVPRFETENLCSPGTGKLIHLDQKEAKNPPLGQITAEGCSSACLGACRLWVHLSGVGVEEAVRKRKTPTVLSAILAKCSWRSTRLQRKSLGTPSLLDVADSSKEEKILVEPNSLGGKNCPQKSPTAALSGKEAIPENPLVNEDLRSHLRVLSSLGTSLTSTYACVNLLTLEIRNYLKEVLIILKEEKNEKV
eukprot:Gb_38035 [translate_table: standard]